MTLTTSRTPTRATSLVLGLALLSGCASGADPAPSGAATAAGDTATGDEPTEIDSCGRTLTLDAPPERAVSLYPGQTELLLRLGVGGRIVGRAQTSVSEPEPDLADQVEAIESLSDDAPPSREILLSVDPDFVLSPTGYEFSEDQGFASIDQLEQAGVAAYTAAAGCFERRASGEVEDTFTDIENLGRIFDVEDAAADLVASARADLEAIAAATADQDPVTVAQVFVDGDQLSAIGGSIEADIIRLAGGDNVFAADESLFADFFAAQVSPEVVADRDPDAFVYATRDEAGAEATEAYLRRTFPNSTAVREGRLIAVRNAQMSPGTLSAIDAVRTIAEGLYPDALR